MEEGGERFPTAAPWENRVTRGESWPRDCALHFGKRRGPLTEDVGTACCPLRSNQDVCCLLGVGSEVETVCKWRSTMWQRARPSPLAIPGARRTKENIKG